MRLLRGIGWPAKRMEGFPADSWAQPKPNGKPTASTMTFSTRPGNLAYLIEAMAQAPPSGSYYGCNNFDGQSASSLSSSAANTFPSLD